MTRRWSLTELLIKLAGLALLLALAAACGSDGPDATPTAATPAAEAATPTAAPATTAAPAEEPAATTAAPSTTSAGDDEQPTPTTTAPTTTTAPPSLRIVSLSPAGTEVLFAIGAGDLVVAADEFSDYPPEAPVVAGLVGWNPNYETVLSFEPDLVITSAGPSVTDQLTELGVDSWDYAAPATFDGSLEAMTAMGTRTGHDAEAAALVERLRTRRDELVAAARGAVTGAGLTYFHELDDLLYSVTSKTFIGDVYGMVGLTNVADAADESGFGYPQVQAEYLLDVDPDIIFFADGACCGQTVDTISSRDGWQALSAVANGHVYEANADLASRWGPRLIDYLEFVITTIGRSGLADIDLESVGLGT